MAGYVSIYAGSNTATVPNSNKANPFAGDFTPGQYARKSQPTTNTSTQSKPKPAPAPPKSLLSKTGSVAKSVGNAAITGERTFATGIARDLPAGTADLNANQQATEQANKNIKLAKTSNMSPTQSKKLIQENASTGANTQKDTASIIKNMPSKTRLALSAASTAADIATGGALPELKGASLTAKIARTGTQAGAYGTAGALNSAAGGGNKKQIAENFVTGAALPGVLHVAAKGISKAYSAVDKADANLFARDSAKHQAVKTTFARSLLDASRSMPDKTAALDTNTTKSVNTIMDKVHTPKSVIDKAQAQSDATAAAKEASDKAAIETQKTVDQGKKLDDQIELINAKKADGKFTNVDKTKVAQLTKQKAALNIPDKTIVPTDTNAIKSQIKKIRSDDTSYDETGNFKPEVAKQINTLHKQLNATGERVPAAEKPVTNVPIEEPKKGESPIPQIKTSKLAQGIEANAVKKGLADGFEGKAEYAQVNISRQTKAAVDLIKSDPELAVKIAMGQVKPPEGLLPESVFIAVENAATKSGDADLLRRLATESHLTSEASGMGQRIRMLGERENTSPVSAIKKVSDAKAAAVKARTGKTVTQAVSDEVKQIRAAKPQVTKETFTSFVDSLRC